MVIFIFIIIICCSTITLLITINIVVTNFIITLMVLQNICSQHLHLQNAFISPFLKDMCGKKLPSFVVYSPISSPDKISGRENLPIALHPPKLFSVYVLFLLS